MDDCERVIPFQAALTAEAKRIVCYVPYYLMIPREGNGCGCDNIMARLMQSSFDKATTLLLLSASR